MPANRLQRSVSNIFVIARHTVVTQRLRRQVRCRRSDRLYAGLFVVGDDRNCRDFPRSRGGGLLQQLDFTIDAQDFRHLLVEQGIAAFQIIAHLVRLDFIRGENFAQRALSKIGEAFVSRRRPMFVNVSRQQPRRPQLVRIPEILGFCGKQDRQQKFAASSVMARSRPGRGLSSRASMMPSFSARRKHLSTV